MRLVMSARPKPQTRNRYDKRIVEDIVQHVVDGKIYPTSKNLEQYASCLFGKYVCQSTIANWFSERKISLIDCKRRYEALHALRPVTVDYYLPAPNSAHRAISGEPAGDQIVTFVVSQLQMKRVITLCLIQRHLEYLVGFTYPPESIRQVCQRYLLTYRLPDVVRSGITYNQYQALVYKDFPSLFNY